MPLWSTWLVFRLASIKPLFLKNHSFLSPSGSVPIKEHAFPRSCPLAFTITAITSLQKKIFLSPYPSLPWVERFSIRLWLSLFIGRIPCLTFAENNICILSCRERSWHWPVKASGRIRSWNVEESSMKVSVLFGRSQGNNTTLMLKLRVGKQTKKYVLTFIRTNGRNATTRNGNNDNCQQHESKRGLHDGVIRLNNIQNLKDNTK